jgi:hypothetical protein
VVVRTLLALLVQYQYKKYEYLTQKALRGDIEALGVLMLTHADVR